MNNIFSNLKMAFPALGMLSSLCVYAEDNSADEKKNVLFIIVDDLRPELNCYGAKYMKTPNIDRLASQGVMFENAYCNIPVSGASRASLFSGLRPANNRYWDVQAEIDREAHGTVTLPQVFKENGYVTISNSKVIHGKNDAKERSWSELWMPRGKSKTWRDYLGDENLAVEKQKGGPKAYECLDVKDNEYFDGKTVNKSIRDLKKLKETGQPFFLAVGILKPHLPFNAPKKYWDMYDFNDIDVPETFEFNRDGFPQQAFHTYNDALSNLNKVRRLGFSSAIIRAYNDGEFVNTASARALEKKIASNVLYQVVIDGYSDALPQEMLTVVRSNTNKDIAKVSDSGTTRFVIGPFGSKGEAETLVAALKVVSDQTITVETVK